MKRRTALALGGIAALCPAIVLPQATRQFRVGWLHPTTRAGADVLEKAFLSGMRERGYVPGKNLLLEVRAAEGDTRRISGLARELVALRPDVIIAVETTARAIAALNSTIPIVLFTSIDPVAAGLVKSLASPGTNVTGMVDQFELLVAKHVELLIELSPSMSRVALLNERNWSARESYERHARQAAKSKGLELIVATVSDPGDLPAAFADFQQRKAEGLIVAATAGPLMVGSQTIREGAQRLKMPAISPFRGYSEAGGLISYGPDIPENCREAADFVARIFEGQKPAELPMRQTKRFLLIVNLKTAREIGVTVPQSILLRADQVID